MHEAANGAFFTIGRAVNVRANPFDRFLSLTLLIRFPDHRLPSLSLSQFPSFGPELNQQQRSNPFRLLFSWEALILLVVEPLRVWSEEEALAIAGKARAPVLLDDAYRAYFSTRLHTPLLSANDEYLAIIVISYYHTDLQVPSSHASYGAS
jgi:hypothetical protein